MASQHKSNKAIAILIFIIGFVIFTFLLWFEHPLFAVLIGSFIFGIGIVILDPDGDIRKDKNRIKNTHKLTLYNQVNTTITIPHYNQEKQITSMEQEEKIQVRYYKKYLKNGNAKYCADLFCPDIAEHKIIEDYSEDFVKLKVDDIKAKWENKISDKEATDMVSSYCMRIKEINDEIENILIDGLQNKFTIEQLYQGKLPDVSEIENEISEIDSRIKVINDVITNASEQENQMPTEPKKEDYSIEDKPIYKIFPFLKRRHQKKKNKEFDIAFAIYRIELQGYYERDGINRDRLSTLKNLEDTKQNLTEGLLKQNSARDTIIQAIQKSITDNDNSAIEDYVCRLLEHSSYPIEWDKNPTVVYNGQMLAIDYCLPSIDIFPSLSEVKYVKGTIKKTELNKKTFSQKYNDAIYRITLRSLYELFYDEMLSKVESTAFNGWVTVVDKKIGKPITNYILSIVVKREEILDIDFLNVDPKLCFNALKGIASSNLATVTPIAPIVVLNKEDKRFIEHYEVVSNLNNSTNLAAMDWQDFENLIREIFEKEFQSTGGEVKITRPSRDGGVDAIAYDPDPIRGGKIVIQAKRYTNIVGVSAVRDLYGTVMNEGATKGIIVTTSDYGGDSYAFSKGKPLTLINGSHLLYLLEKHGVHAKIDIEEARKIMSNEIS